MTYDTTTNIICEILLNQAGYIYLKEVTPDTTRQQLGADSLDEVEIVMELENKFSIELPDDIWENVQTVRDLINNVKNHMPEQMAHG